MRTLSPNNLNSNEVTILKAIVAAHSNAGGDFTYADEVYEEVANNFTMSQIKGYLSQLVQKGYIMIDEEFEQINFLDSIYKVFPDLDNENFCSVYGENGNV